MGKNDGTKIIFDIMRNIMPSEIKELSLTYLLLVNFDVAKRLIHGKTAWVQEMPWEKNARNIIEELENMPYQEMNQKCEEVGIVRLKDYCYELVDSHDYNFRNRFVCLVTSVLRLGGEGSKKSLLKFMRQYHASDEDMAKVENMGETDYEGMAEFLVDRARQSSIRSTSAAKSKSPKIQEPAGRAKSTLALPASTGIYRIEDSQLEAALLPSIICSEKRYDYQRDAGSPLRQIISENQYPWIFLCGRADDSGSSTVSGSGKTSSLRFLAHELQSRMALWLPLAEVYSRHNMKYPDNLNQYISRRFHIMMDALPDSSLLLLDGLDELLLSEQLERLSGDLSELQRQRKFGLVISSKLPWEQLPYAKVLYQWGSVWYNFLPCVIQTLSERQIITALTDSGKYTDGAVFQLNTPFLLSLYLRTTALPDDVRTISIIKRWCTEALFQNSRLTTEILFYRALIVQIIRWSEAAQGQELQWEMDAFLLLHVLPSIACQMMRAEIIVPSLDPAVETNFDLDFVKMRIRDVWAASQHGLSLFPGYSQNSFGTRYRQILNGLNHVNFINSAASSLMSGEWMGEDDYAEQHFINLSFRNNLACLHLSNTFLLAQEGMLETTEAAIKAYGQTVEFMPSDQLSQAIGFFELIAPDEDIRSILRQGPKEYESALSQFMAGHIGLTLCENVPEFRDDRSISSEPWYVSMIIGMQGLESHSSTELRALAEKRFSFAYIFGLTAYFRGLRESNQYEEAAKCIDLAFSYQNRHPQVKNSDGYHMKASLLWKQITSILNGNAEINIQEMAHRLMSAEELIFADELHAELEGMRGGQAAEGKWLTNLSPGQMALVPIFFEVLDKAKARRSAYAEQQFVDDGILNFLCSASYLAKAYSIYAALSPGNSGLAYNLLGSLVANDSEELENDPQLLFFKENPRFHLNVTDLAYSNRFVSAFQIYLQLYNIRKGSQPYSARRLSEMLLCRQVRLDEDNRPVSARGDEPFTAGEMQFMEQATARAVLNHGNCEAYWRVRFLHEFVRSNVGYENGVRHMGNVRRELRSVWKKCSCDKKLQRLGSSDYKGVDSISVLVILEDLLLDDQKDQETRNTRYRLIFGYLHWYRDQIRKAPEFTTGACAQYSYIQDCLSRISRLKQNSDDVIVQHMISICNF